MTIYSELHLYKRGITHVFAFGINTSIDNVQIKLKRFDKDKSAQIDNIGRRRTHFVGRFQCLYE